METQTTDVTLGTNALLFMRYLREEREAYWDARVKMKTFAEQYIREMKQADIPFVLKGQPLIQLFHDFYDVKERKGGKKLAKVLKYKTEMLFSKLFGEGFADQHQISLSGISVQGYDMHAVDLQISDGTDTFKLYVPVYENMKINEKNGAEYGFIHEYDFKFCAHVLNKKESSEHCTSYEFIDGDPLCSYDWKVPCNGIRDAIERNSASKAKKTSRKKGDK